MTTPTKLAEAIAEVWPRTLTNPRDIAHTLLALPTDRRVAIATELLDVDLPESMTPGEIHVYGGEQGGIGIIGWSSVGIPMGSTFTEHAFLWAIGKLLAALKGA